MFRTALLLLVGLVLCANMMWSDVPSGNIKQVSSAQYSSSFSISDNETYGTNGTVSQYFVGSNLSISATGSLTFYDTMIEVENVFTCITVAGSLLLHNSSIVAGAAGSNLSLSVTGTPSKQAVLGLYQSTVAIPGAIDLANTTATILDSNLSSGYSDTNTIDHALTLGISNSSIDASNSSFSGLMKTNDSVAHEAGTGIFDPSVPVSANTSISYTFVDGARGDVRVTGVEANVTFSGNNPTGENSLTFGYGNQTYTFIIPDTGSIMSDQNANIDLPIGGKFQNLTSFDNALSTKMQMNGKIGSNSSIEKICLEIQTNDSVDLFGARYFSYGIEGSNVTFMNCSLSVDTNDSSGYRNLPDPEHDYIDASNSVINLADSSVEDSGNASFFVIRNSTLNYFTLVEVHAHSGAYDVSNFHPLFAPSLYVSYAVSANSAIASAIDSSGISLHSTPSCFNSYLLTGFINNSGYAYTGSYNVTIYNQQYALSLMPYSLSTPNIEIENYSTNLPVVSMQAGTSYLIEDQINPIDFAVKDLSSENLSFNYSCILTLGGTELPMETGGLKVNGGGTASFQVNESVGYFPSENATIDVSLQSNAPLYTGYYCNASFTMPLFVSSNISMIPEYRWISDQSVLGVELSFSGSKAPFPAAVDVNVSTNTSGVIVFSNQTLELGAGENFSRSCELALNVSSVPDSVEIVYAIVNENPSNVVEWKHDLMPVIGNSSYFAFSTVVFNENGLPEGTFWSILINNTPYSSFTGSVIVNLSHGVYQYTIPGVSGYTVAVDSGILYTDNSTITVNLVFSPYLFKLDITESGLAIGTNWYVIVDGKNYSGTNSSIEIMLSNGTYSITAVADGYSTIGTENITILGSGSNCSLIFSPTKHTPFYLWGLESVLESQYSYFAIVILLISYLTFFRPGKKYRSNKSGRKKNPKD